MNRFSLSVFGVALGVMTFQSSLFAVSVIPDLETAANFALLAIPQQSDSASVTVSSASTLTGNIGVGSPGSYTKSGSAVVIGSVFLSAGVTTSISGSGSGGTLVPNSDLSQAIADALAASSDAAALAPTQVLGNITSTQTITGNGGLNVLSINTIELSGVRVLTLSGTAADFFILNISGGFDLSGSSAIVLVGGVDPAHVLYHFPSSGADIGFTASSTVKGTFLAPFRDFTLHGATLQGAIIANDIRISSGGQVLHTAFEVPQPPPPESPVIPEAGSVLLFGLGAAMMIPAQKRWRRLTS